MVEMEVTTLAPRVGQSMKRQTNKACLQAHLAAEGRHDMESTLKTLHPECVFVYDLNGLLRQLGHSAFELPTK
jgi:hypothetical protein